MTLPSMKIWTGGDRHYSERVQRALFERGKPWVNSGFQFRGLSCNGISVGPSGISGITSQEGFDGLNRPAYRLAPNGNLVPQEADDEGWIEWGGGDAPVSDGKVSIRQKEGPFYNGLSANIVLPEHWHHSGRPGSEIVWYRPDSLIFPTSQRKPEPVHQMKHGDYILREDIPDEATFRRVCEAMQRQGYQVIDGFGDDPSFPYFRIMDGCDKAGWCGEVNATNRVYLSDIGITTQEADMTPCEQKGLREGQWVWAVSAPTTSYKGGPLRVPGWVQLERDDSSTNPLFQQGPNGSCLSFNKISWQAGIRNEKPGTEDSMSETLTEAQALREVAQGYEDGDENPWERIEAQQHITHAWMPVSAAERFEDLAVRGHQFRRKPCTVRMNGDIGEWAVKALEEISRNEPSLSASPKAVADEILSMVQDQ